MKNQKDYHYNKNLIFLRFFGLYLTVGFTAT